MGRGAGQLSGITLGMNFAGVAARVFTTLQEVDDNLVLLGFLAALSCNAILFFQVCRLGALGRAPGVSCLCCSGAAPQYLFYTFVRKTPAAKAAAAAKKAQ